MRKDVLALPTETIEELCLLQIERRLSWRKLAAEMGVNRESLRRGLAGRRIWSVDAARISNWLAEQNRKAAK